MEILEFLQSPATVSVNVDRLGVVTEKYKQALKGKFASIKSGNKKADWNKLAKGFGASLAHRCRLLILKMLDAKPGQQFRDDSTSFGHLLKQWRAKWIRRHAKEKNLAQEVHAVAESCVKSAG